MSEHMAALEPVRKQVRPLWTSWIWSGYLCLIVIHKSLKGGGILESGKFSVKFFKEKNYSSDVLKNKCSIVEMGIGGKLLSGLCISF